MSTKPRQTFKPGGSFVWLSKEALRLIRDGYDGQPGLTNALAVYLTLTETANREGKPSVEVRQRNIAATSGCSPRTVARVLQHLQQIGVVTWTQTTGEGTHPLGPNVYTITPYPSATIAHPSANTADPSASPRNGTVAENVEEPEEPSEEPLEERSADQTQGTPEASPVGNMRRLVSEEIIKP